MEDDDGNDRRYMSMLEKQTLDLLEHISRMQTEHASLDEHYRHTIRALEQANKKLRRESALLRGYSTYSDELALDDRICDAPRPMTPQQLAPAQHDDPLPPLTPPDSSNKSHARHTSCPSYTQHIRPVIPQYAVQTNSNHAASRWIIAGWTAVYIRYLLVLVMALITRALLPPPPPSPPSSLAISKNAFGKSTAPPRRSRTVSNI